MYDPGQLETAKAQAYNVKTPPGQMSELSWKVRPSVEIVDAQERGDEVPPRYVIICMGAQHPETPLGY